MLVIRVPQRRGVVDERSRGPLGQVGRRAEPCLEAFDLLTGGMGRLGASIPASIVSLARAVAVGTSPRALGEPEARQVAPGRVRRSLHRALAFAFLADGHASLVDVGGGPHGEGPGPRPPRPGGPRRMG